MLEDEDKKCRLKAMEILVSLKREGRYATQIQHMLQDRSPKIRRLAIETLVNLGKQEAVVYCPAIARKMLDTDGDVRAAAILAVVAMGQVELFSDDISHTFDDDHAAVREAALHAVTSIGPDTPTDVSFLDLAVELLDDASKAVRLAACECLRIIDIYESRCLSPLLQQMKEEQDIQVRLAAARTLAVVGQPSTIVQVRNLLKSEPSREVKEELSKCLDVLSKRRDAERKGRSQVLLP
jgi:HEAT repeat protein